MKSSNILGVMFVCLLAVPCMGITSFLVADNNGLCRVSDTGTIQPLLPASDCYRYTGVEVLGNHFYTYDVLNKKIGEYTLAANKTRDIPVPNLDGQLLDLAAISDGRFALTSNETDQIYFLDSNGSLLQTVKLLAEPDSHLQSLDHVQVGNTLYVSEDGNSNVLAIDLTSYSVSVFKSFSFSISGLDYHAGSFYSILAPNHFWKFTSSDSPVFVGDTPTSNAARPAVDDNYAWITVNFSNSLYRMDLSDGSCETITSNLAYPKDIEFIPEPASLFLLLTGVAAFGRKRRK